MNLLNKLTIKNLKLNKKRSIVTIIGIILSVALITALSTMYASFIDSSIKYETYLKGNYHLGLKEVNKTDLKTLSNNSKIKEISIINNLGYSKLEKCTNIYKPYLYIKAYDKNALKNLTSELIEGRFPENDNELVIPEHLKNNGQVNIKVGDTITLNIGKRVSDNHELNQDNTYNEENEEEIKDTITKTYKVVGKVKRPNGTIEPYSAPGYTVITYLNNTNNIEHLDIYMLYTNKGIKENTKVTSNILGFNEAIYKKFKTTPLDLTKYELEQLENPKYAFMENDYLMKLQTNPLSISSMKGLGAIVIVVLAIIIVTSVLCIKNSFDISITEKIKQYGMLKSIGATKKQIKKNVLYEALILGLIAIPLGILSGLFAATILIMITNKLLLESLSSGLHLVISISFLPILLSIILGIITIYFSSLKSAKKAKNVSPIDSIRNSAEIKINRKKIKTPKLINKLFGISGVIALKNIRRNKKRYRTTIISLALSILTFIPLYYFTNTMKEGMEQEFRSTKANYSIGLLDYYENIDLINQAVKLDNIKDYSIYRTTVFNLKNPKYNQEFVKSTHEVIDNDTTGLSLVVLGDHAYKTYIKELGLNYKEVSNKAIMIDTTEILTINKKNKRELKKVNRFTYQKGDKINGIASSYTDDEIEQIPLSLEIATVTNKFPVGGNDVDTSLIITDKYLKDNNIKIEAVYLNFDSTDVDYLEDNLENIFKDQIKSTNNLQQLKQQEDNVLLLINIFLYGFIIVISLIGITNIFNTITTSMELRRQEFAMLKSIGMTKKEFNKLINLESIFIGTKSLIYGIIIGTILSFVMYKFSETDELFKLPIIPIIISIVIVFILITTLMKYSINKINKQNTIETIRNENI